MLALLLAGLVSTVPAAAPPDVCPLLEDTEVRAVQGVAPEARVASRQPGALRLGQCFYRTPDVTSSVSLAVALEGADLWRRQFHGAKAQALRAGLKKEKPPEAVPGLGDEAWWVGDSRTGSLYVRVGEAFLRLSVGGGEAATRSRRARALAEKALARLEGPAPAN
jgi:hypothetical protein